MSKIRIHFIQHVNFEAPALIEKWALNKHCHCNYSLMGKDTLPDIDSFDMLVIMGGPMGVYDNVEFPWIAEELDFIRNAIKANKPLLGVCLGAQFIAAALGARVFKNKQKEIGWFPIDLDNKLIPELPTQTTVFHWHGDTFELPADARWLAGSKATKNQAFIYGDRVLAIQFHLEMNEQSIKLMLENCGDEIVLGEFIQTINQIKQGLKENSENEKVLNTIMDYLSGRIK